MMRFTQLESLDSGIAAILETKRTGWPWMLRTSITNRSYGLPSSAGCSPLISA